MKFYKLQIFTLVLMSFILGCSEFIVVGILSDISDSLHISVAQAGHFVTIFALVYAVATPIITSLLGRYRRYHALIVLTCIFIFGNFFSFFSAGYWPFLISRVITAVVSGPMISLGLTFTNLIAPPEKRPEMVSYVFSGFSIASVFGVPIGTWLSEKAGWNSAFLAIALFSVPAFVLIVLTLPKTTAEKPVRVADSLHILKDPRIQIGVLLPLFSAAGFYVFYTYLSPILISILNYDPSSVSTFLFVFGIASILSNLLSGGIAKRSGVTKMHFVFMLQSILFFSLPVLLRSQVSGTIVILLLGISMYLLNSPIQMHFFAVAEKDYPESVVFAASFNSIFFNFGISAGSFLGSLIVDRAGLRYVGLGGGALAVVTTLLLLFLNHLNFRHAVQRAPDRNGGSE